MNLMIPKTKPFVSKTLRDFARGQDCTLNLEGSRCDPETVVLCHIRAFGIAGMAQKPHDFFAYHGCAECHAREKDAGWDELFRAMIKTQSRVYEQFGGLTP